VAETFMLEGRWDELILVGEAHVDSPSLPEPERARLSSTLAHAFRRKGEFDRALQHAQRAVRLWPNREGPAFLHQRTDLGRIALEAGRREEALVEFRGVARARDADATNLASAAWGLYMAGATAEAAEQVDRAIAADAGFGNAYHLRGWLRLAQGQHAAAAEDFRLAFERTPRAFGSAHHGLVNGDLAALYYSGVAWLEAGDRKKAGQVLERLIAHCQRLQSQRAGQAGQAPDWQLANYLARAHARLGQPVVEPARLAGDDTTYFVQTARLHAVQGHREQALKELSQGLALGHGELRHVQDDPDFASLRGAPEFRRLVTDRLPAGGAL
jgi:tetratricopeptide (TPR) repeat protein